MQPEDNAEQLMETATEQAAAADGDPISSLHEATAATAPAEPQAEPRAAAGRCSTQSGQAAAETNDPSAALDLQKAKVQLGIEKTKCSFLEDEVKELQADKAFLQSQPAAQGKGQSGSGVLSLSFVSLFKMSRTAVIRLGDSLCVSHLTDHIYENGSPVSAVESSHYLHFTVIKSSKLIQYNTLLSTELF
ncbi:hypothetical protein AOLI_G00323310, partial [Acnodon oligacanthus]